MSVQGRPSWWHPLLRLHDRHVHKQITAAQAAAAELGLDLQVAAIREALAYRRWEYWRSALKFVAIASALGILSVARVQASCTPGGMFNPSPGDDCSRVDSWWPLVAQAAGVMAFLVLLMWPYDAMRGETISRCSKPLYLLLDLLASAAAVARPGTPYVDAIKLSRKVSGLGLPLRTFARHAAADFGDRRALRTELRRHVDRVNVTFAEAANQLASTPESSARRLSELAAHSANSIAAGRFVALLPEEMIAQDTPLEPDRLDGRRLGSAVLLAVVVVTAFFIVLSPLGAPVEIVVTLALVAFPATVFTLLAFRYGLSEATRLTRSIGSFFSASPPL